MAGAQLGAKRRDDEAESYEKNGSSVSGGRELLKV